MGDSRAEKSASAKAAAISQVKNAAIAAQHRRELEKLKASEPRTAVTGKLRESEDFYKHYSETKTDRPEKLGSRMVKSLADIRAENAAKKRAQAAVEAKATRKHQESGQPSKHEGTLNVGDEQMKDAQEHLLHAKSPGTNAVAQSEITRQVEEIDERTMAHAKAVADAKARVAAEVVAKKKRETEAREKEV